MCVCVCGTMAGFQTGVPQPVSGNKDKLRPVNRNVLLIELMLYYTTLDREMMEKTEPA